MNIRLRSSRGFTIPEVLVGVSLFSVLMVGLTPALMTYQRLNSRNAIRTAAMALAQSELDTLRLQDPSTMPASGSEVVTRSMDGFAFELTRQYCPSGTTYCTSENIRHLRLLIKFKRREIYEADTVYTRLR